MSDVVWLLRLVGVCRQMLDEMRSAPDSECEFLEEDPEALCGELDARISVASTIAVADPRAARSTPAEVADRWNQ